MKELFVIIALRNEEDSIHEENSLINQDFSNERYEIS